MDLFLIALLLVGIGVALIGGLLWGCVRIARQEAENERRHDPHYGW